MAFGDFWLQIKLFILNCNSSKFNRNFIVLSILNSYCYRAVNIPLDDDDFQMEVNKIHQIAKVKWQDC